MQTNSFSPSFKGITKIYAISDAHQETRKTGALLSKILKDTVKDKNVLFLNGGDIFKGIYPRELEKDCYIKLKEAKPNLEMVMTLGNNDFGFNKESLDFLISSIKNFTQKGIHTVCANIFETNGNRPNWLKPYAIIERDGDRSLVTGFCINNINTQKFGLVAKHQKEVLKEIEDAIIREKPDNVIILNHDYMPSSQEIVKYCKENNINIDLVIGGHDHDIVPPDTKLNIYHPHPFCESMYKINLVNNKNKHGITQVENIINDNLPLNPIFEKEIVKHEKETGLLDTIVPSTLDLKKQYSSPCALGSFLADNMMKTANADIAFFSTGFLMRPLEYKPNSNITNYVFKKTMIADTPIKTVELDIAQLKRVFENALKSYGYGSSNPKFLQCSNNIRIIGKDHPETNSFEVLQIYINNEALLDGNSTPLDFDKKFKCAIDSYIAEGGQGYKILQDAEKKEVLKNNTPAKINEILIDGLKDAYTKYKPGTNYPCFQITTTL